MPYCTRRLWSEIDVKRQTCTETITVPCFCSRQPLCSRSASTGKNQLWYSTTWWRKPTGVCVPVWYPSAPCCSHSRREPWDTWGYVYLCWACRRILTGPRACLQFLHPPPPSFLCEKTSCYYYDSNGGYTFLAQGSGAARRNSNAQKMKISGKLSSFFLPTPTLLAVCMCP